MAKKNTFVDYSNTPEALTNHPFYGLMLDDEQTAFRDAVWKRDKLIYLINSMAGTGKTLVSVAIGMLMVKYGFYDKIVYITFPGMCEKSQGYLPGTLEEKSQYYFQPLNDALIEIGENPDKVCSNNAMNLKNGNGIVDCCVATYMRGINIHKSFVILDESQNADLDTLTKVISRISDDSVCVIIGHTGQCDLEDKSKSGFAACIDYQIKYHSDISCSFYFKTNHRGFISQYADLMLSEYTNPQYGFVYMTRNKVNGKMYIGQHKRTMDSKDIDDSWYLGSGVLLKKAIAKYGEENFERVILYECSTQDQLNYMEEMFTLYYDVVDDETFYNLCIGGTGVKRHQLTEEQKDNMRKKHKPMDESKRKNMAREYTKTLRKPVEQYDLNNNLLNEFDSLTTASEETGCDFRLISACCLGRRKTHKGFIWKYKD